MTVLTFVALALVLACLFERFVQTRADRRAKIALRAEIARLQIEVSSLMIPLIWAFEASRSNDSDSMRRVRYAMTSAITMVQTALQADDQNMAERVVAVPDPPRRLPRYSRVPPYLATPEDVAQVPEARPHPTPEG